MSTQSASLKVIAVVMCLVLNGTKNVRIHGNTLKSPKALRHTRTEALEADIEQAD